MRFASPTSNMERRGLPIGLGLGLVLVIYGFRTRAEHAATNASGIAGLLAQ
jgi:hypothetical protein